jgi:hypothetical protein
MSYIVPPNFWTSSAPTYSMFNDMAKAIGSVIGGTYYDEFQSSYAIASGNLDATNISSSPKFRNSQKSEPYSLFYLNASGMTIAATSTVLPDLIPISCPPIDFSVISIGVEAGNGSTSVITGGFITLYLNAIPQTTITFNNDISGAATSGQPSYSPLNLNVPASSWMLLDYSQLTGFGSSPSVPASSIAYINVTLLCKAMQAR